MYTGETGRTLKVRMGDVNNGLAAHSLKRTIELSEAKPEWWREKRTGTEEELREALKIQQCQVRMNLDQGIVFKSD